MAENLFLPFPLLFLSISWLRSRANGHPGKLLNNTQPNWRQPNNILELLPGNSGLGDVLTPGSVAQFGDYQIQMAHG